MAFLVEAISFSIVMAMRNDTYLHQGQSMHTKTGVKGRISNVGGNLQTIGVQFFFFFLFFLCICVRILLKGSYLSLH